MGSVAGEVDLDCCAGLVCAGAANAHSPCPAAAAVEVDCDAPARRFGNRFRRSTVAIGCGGEELAEARRQLGQGDAKARRAAGRPRIRCAAVPSWSHAQARRRSR